MRDLSSLTPPFLVVILVVQLLLTFASNPVYLAPTGVGDSDVATGQTNSSTSSASSSSSSSEVGQDAQNTGARAESSAAPTDFVQDESQYQAILEQLRREAAESVILDPGNFVAPDATVEEIMQLVEKAENAPAASQEQQPAAVAQTQSQLDEVDCAICLGPLKDDSLGKPEVVVCGHMFHADCIELWRERKALASDGGSKVPCPMCRTDIGAARASEPEPVKVTIETSNGHHFVHQFKPNEKVFEVKKFILAHDAIPITDQEISMDGRFLDDNRTLGSYGVNARSPSQPYLKQYKSGNLCSIM